MRDPSNGCTFKYNQNKLLKISLFVPRTKLFRNNNRFLIRSQAVNLSCDVILYLIISLQSIGNISTVYYRCFNISTVYNRCF